MNPQNEKFENPYSGLAPEHRHRTTIDITKEDRAFIAGIHIRSGTLQTTIGILLTKFIEAIKQQGLSTYDPDRYERAVASCVILPGGSPEADAHLGQQRINDAIARSTAAESGPPHPRTEAPDRNVGRGATGVAQQDKGCAGEPSNAPSAHQDVKPQGRKGRGKTK